MTTILFIGCGILIGYVLFGYPLGVWLIARLAARPTLKAFRPRTVTVILPVHNGAQRIAAKLDTILALDYPRELLEVIVVSDGSTDATEAIAEGYARSGVKVLRMPKSGKSSALNAGIAEARGEILFFTDIRQRLSPNSLHDLVECFEDPSVGVASGELIIVDGQTRGEADVGLYWRYEKWIRRSISAFSSVPGATGCIYAMRRSLARPLPPHTLCDDMYLPLAAHLDGARIIFEERAKAYDQPSAINAEFDRKVRTLAGVYQILGRLPGVLNPARPVFPHFVSHKLGRLLLPYALIAAFILALLIPGSLGILLFAAQLAFYLIAVLDPIVPQTTPLKWLSSPTRTFVILVLAALSATAIFFRPVETFWKPTRIQQAGG